MTDIPTIEPSYFVAGDTVVWQKQLADYPSSDGWSLTYYFANKSDSRSVFASAISDDTYQVRIEAAESILWLVDLYRWTGKVIKAPDEFTVLTGRLEVKPALTSIQDTRSHAERVVDALEATIEGKATSDQLSLSVSGQSISRMTPQDMVFWLSFYRGEVVRQRDAESGKPGTSSIMVASF